MDRRPLLVLLLMSNAGCSGVVQSRPRDDAAEIDAGSGDDAAVAPMDAGDLDAPGLDAAADPMDAWTAPMDAFVAPDATWGPCTSGGVSGTCISTSLCAGTSVRGLCPGPSDIQCCVAASDAGMMLDAPGGSVTVADVLARLGACTRIGGNYAKDVGGTSDIPICQTDTVIWWTADMDIDCDGGQGAICMSDPDYLPDTSGVDSLGNPLDASTLPFMVIPLASTRFRYTDYGIRTGQVALVMYNGRMVFGIFGDAGPSSIIGEASFAMAEALGIPSSPRTGGVDSGVTYLVFTGTGARVTRNEDHAEAVSIGTSLLNGFVGP